MKKDIENIDDIKLLVNTFYGRVQQDKMIGAIFNEKLEGRWDEHLEKMYSFWQTILLEEYTYHGKPFPPHAYLPISSKHFERWKVLFNSTVNEFFEGVKADEAQWRAGRMATMFLSKIEYCRLNESKPLF